MKFTRTEINFLKDVPSNIIVDKSSGWRLYYVNNYELSTFIRGLDFEYNYLLIPEFLGSMNHSEVKLQLSDPFLVNDRSDPDLIIKFIIDQWNNSVFTLKSGNKMTLVIKFKRIWLSNK